MKTTTINRPTVFILAVIAALSILANTALAQSGTWSNTAGGSWADSANWSGGTIAAGSGNTADFSTLTLGAAPTVTLDGAQTIGNLIFGDVGNAYGWTLNPGIGDPLTLAVSSGAPTITVNNQTNTIGLALAGTQGLIKAGAGTLSLTGVNTYTGTTTITNGTLIYSDSGAASGAGTLVVGGANGKGIFNMNSSGTVNFTTGTPIIGGNGGTSDTGVGALNQTAGTLNLAANGAYMTLGDSGSSASYGSLNLSGGTLNITSGAGMRIGSGGLGSYVQSGGTFSCGRYFVVGGNFSSTAPDTGVATFTGGSATVNSSYYIILGNLSGSKGVLNLGTEAGGNATLTSASGTGPNIGNVSGSTGTLNLNSGTLTINGPIITVSGGKGTVNLNGGMIQAGASATLINTTPTSVNVYNGGVTFDSQGNTATVSANLLATTGNGIYPSGGVFNIGSGGGSGYIGAPLVTVSGGSGGGAQAIANVSGGVVTGVTMTSPGTNYLAGDNVSFAFAGGGATTAASTFTYALAAGDIAANATGGLTKIGSGALTLSGTNTYSGVTTLGGGTIRVVNNNHNLSAGPVVVSANSTLATASSGAAVTLTNPVSINSGVTLTVDSGFFPLTFSAPITNSGNFATTSSGITTLNATNTYTGNTTAGGTSTLMISGSGSLGGGNYNGSIAIGSTLIYTSSVAQTFGGVISGSGIGGLKVNAGTLTLTAANTYTAPTTVNGGILNGTGSITSPTTVASGGTLMAGTLASMGTFSINNSLTFNLGGTNVMRINKTGATLTSDLLQGMTSVAYNGTLTVTATGDALVEGDTFTLYNASGYSGAFAAYNLPTLTAGLSWDKSQLTVNGSIRVIAGTGATDTPVFNPPAGNYLGAQLATISSSVGSTIFYTTDGSDPTISATRISGISPITGIIIPVNITETINAYATNSGTTPSVVASATYVTVPTGIWTNTASGSWSVNTNWNLDVVASGSGFTADFSQVTLLNNTTVSVNAAETIGTLLFGDQGNAYGWIVNGSGPLTLAASGTPSIIISNQSLTLSTVVAGTNGLLISGNGGAGTLTMNNAANSFSGNLTLSGVSVINSTMGGSTTFDLGAKTAGRTLTINSNATLNFTINNVFGGGGMNATNLPTLVINGLMFSSQYNAMPNLVLNGGTLEQSVLPSGSYQGYQFLGSVTVGGTSASTISADNNGNDDLFGGGTIFNVALTGASGPDLLVSAPLRNASADYGSSAGILIKTGAGTMQLSGGSTYTGATVVSNGLLQIIGSIGNSTVTISGGTLEVDGSTGTNAVTVNGGTLDGTGYITGPVTVNSGTLAPGTAAGTGTLYIYNNSLTLSGGTTVMRINKTGGSITSDALANMTSVTYGGALTVTDITTDGTPFAAGDTFYLFNGSGYSGAFATLNLPALPAGLSWDVSGLTLNGSVTVSANAPIPSFNPVSGGYVGALPVTISSGSGATIHYTTDGSDPLSSGTVQSGASPVTVTVPANTASETIIAYATQSGLGNSSEASATYATIAVPTWTNPSSDYWGNNYNWSNNVIANAAGVTADFSTLTLTADTTVTLNTPATVGSLVFGDQGNAFNWILADGGAGPLKLNAGATMPVVNVVNTNTIIALQLSSTNGLTKAGNGTLTLTNYSGSTLGSIGTNLVINQGVVQFSGAYFNQNPFGHEALNVLVNSGGTLRTTAAHALGGDNTDSGTSWGQVWVVGGTLDISGSQYISGGISNGLGHLVLQGANVIGSADLRTVDGGTTEISSLASATTSTIACAGGIGIRGTLTLDVARGTAASDLIISTPLTASTGGGFNKVNTGTLVLSGTNTYIGATVVSNGTLQVDGAIGNGGVTVAGGTLNGNGFIGSAVTVNSGATLAAGSSAGIGALTISNTLSLSGTTSLRLNKTGGVLTNDSVQGLSSVTYGGTLAVTATGDALAAGDSFTLFSAGSYAGSFGVTNLPALTSGLAWDTSRLAADGSIQVLGAVNTNPTNITAVVNGNNLELTWPADHIGWRLQAETNTLATGINTNWVDVPNTDTVNAYTNVISPANGAVFYRMVYH